jgi:hypothetical protein
MLPTILALCARPHPMDAQLEILSKHLSTIKDWNQLVTHAEQQGMGPLLYHHLSCVESPIPNTVRRTLKTLFSRHRQANIIRLESLVQVLSLFEKAGIETLVLKGAALSSLIYPDPGLRPMCDVDLLLQKTEIDSAAMLLQENGFTLTAPTPPRHFEMSHHLNPLVAIRNGLKVSFELHHRLFSPPVFHKNLTFSELAPSAVVFTIHGITAKTPGTADTLWHLYRHGVSFTPIAEVPFRLINAADIVGLVEQEIDHTDWRTLFASYPALKTALPLFHFLTPWSPNVIRRLSMNIRKAPEGVGIPFLGWPRLPLNRIRSTRAISFIRDTLWPPEWWFRLYYAPGSRPAYWKCRFWGHPFHLFKWALALWPFYLQEHSLRLPEA